MFSRLLIHLYIFISESTKINLDISQQRDNEVTPPGNPMLLSHPHNLSTNPHPHTGLASLSLGIASRNACHFLLFYFCRRLSIGNVTRFSLPDLLNLCLQSASTRLRLPWQRTIFVE